MASFFEPLFEKIKGKVKELLGKAEEKKAPVNFIFMVGGFSESPFLKSEIKKIFEAPNLQVLVPRLQYILKEMHFTRYIMMTKLQLYGLL